MVHVTSTYAVSAVKADRRIQLLGLPVDGLTMDEAVSYLKERLEAWRLHPQFGLSSHIVTINPEIGWAAVGDPAISSAIAQAALVVPDGVGILLAARLRGFHLPARVAGFDLMQKLLELAATCGYRVFFLGAAPGVAAEAATAAKRRNKGLQIVGSADGYFREVSEEELVQHIASLQVDILFCALGHPRPAEAWIRKHLQELQVGLAMGVGGSFNVLAGRVTRAPDVMQRLGLEWLYRVYKEPQRLKRLQAIPRYLWRVLWTPHKP